MNLFDGKNWDSHLEMLQVLGLRAAKYFGMSGKNCVWNSFLIWMNSRNKQCSFIRTTN